MNAFLGFGIAALVIAGILLWQALEHRRDRQGYLASEQTTSGTLRQLADAAAAAAGPGAFSQFVDLEGVAEAGPNGLVVSPVSKTECVWHAHRVTREYEEIHHDSDGDQRRQKREEVVDEGRSNAWFHLRDDEGRVAVAPGRTRVDGARKQVSDYRPAEQNDSVGISLGSLNIRLPGGSGGTLGYTYEEWVVLPGTQLYVQGEAEDRRGYITIRDPEGPHKLVISTRSEDELAGDARKGFLLYAAGAGALTVVGLVCLVVGLIKLLG